MKDYNFGEQVPLDVVVPNVFSLTLTPPFLSAVVQASMTIDTVELRKIQYAQELAAYTMRQWMLMREEPEPKHSSVPASTSGPTSSTQNSATSSGRQTRDDVKSMYPSADLPSSGLVDDLLQPYSAPPPMLSLNIALFRET